MGDKDNVLKLATSGQPDKITAAVAELRRMLPGQIEYHRIMAKVKREAFKAYVAEGFTDEQALDLVKALKL